MCDESGMAIIKCERGHTFKVPATNELGYDGPKEPLTPCRQCQADRAAARCANASTANTGEKP